MNGRIIQVERTIIIVGPEDIVRRCLEPCWLKPGEPKTLNGVEYVELQRREVEVIREPS